MVVEQFIEHPKHTKHAQSTKERRQQCDAVECWDEPQTADANHRQCDALPTVEEQTVATIAGSRAYEVDMLRQRTCNQCGGDNCGYECRQDKSSREIGWCNSAFAPYHERCNIADDGKGTSAVGRNDYG